MLVHFPSALLPMAVLLDVSSLYFGDRNLSLFSFYCLCAGTLLGWAALIFGSIDLFKISSGKKSFRTALLHGGLNLLWLFIFTISAGIELKNYPEINYPSAVKIFTEFFAIAGMFYSNFLGGELMLKYDIGKDSIRKED
jgi:uncharacterized membrane protein